MRWTSTIALGICACWLLGGCSRGPQLRGRLAALSTIADNAETTGARRCAPRELALTRAYLEFAALELDKGHMTRAETFVRRAELNAAAAQLQSPRERCGSPPGDQDGDGHPDSDDACPNEPELYQGFEDNDGCPDDPDRDGDGLVDSADSCPILPEDLDEYLDGDGCPDHDNDLDQVLDTLDQCPNEPEDPDGYQDADGCPDLDNDGDGVADLRDQCPNTPGQSEREPLGCPVQQALVVVTDCEVKITQQIHFAYNKAVIKPESYPILDAVIEVLARNESIRLEIQGHTDDRGSDAYNKQLSDQRAHAVRKYLVSHGIAPARLESKGYGEERPIVANASEPNRALNRRVQFMRTEGQKEGCEPAQSSAPLPSTTSQ